MYLPKRRESGRPPRAGPGGPLVAAIAAGLILSTLGCTPGQYASQADKAAYAVIKQKQGLALGEPKPFDITYRPFSAGADKAADQGLLLRGKPIPQGNAPPRALALDECLETAVCNSRSFQTRKEQLYTSALALANLRHDWSLVSGNLLANAGTSRTMRGDSTHSGTGEANLSFARKFASGGVLTLAAGLDAATNFLRISDTAFGSFLQTNLTQPLLRGAWRGFAYEELYRTERDFAYAILEYERFTQTFAVNIATEYYGVLRQRDELQNEMDNLERLRLFTKFDKARAERGIISPVKADQAEQSVLSAEARVQSARQRYSDALDGYKITLGLPIVASIELDKGELEKLKPLPIPFDQPAALRTALRTRPDVLTEYADVRDLERDAEIAADAFNPRLDLVLDISAAGTEPRKPFRTQLHRHTRSASLSFDYALDQTDNRDEYRNALIALTKAERDLEEFLDTVRLNVRRSYRALEQSERTYNIQKAAVALATRRTKLAKREQKLGWATTRDVLEAEDALRSSKNALTSALVSYTTTRLGFLADLGMISVDEQGKIHERNKPFYFDRLRLEERKTDR